MTQISTSSGDLHPRNPWIAALFSVALPGLGQLYNGDLNRALWLFLGFVLFGTFPGVTIAALDVPAVLMMPLLLISVGLTFGIWVVAIVDAWRGAVRRRSIDAANGRSAASMWCRCWPAARWILMLAGEVRQRMVQTFNIPTAAMQPGILRGDWLFADKRYNCPGCKTAVAIGDIGIFVYPNDRTQYYIKRVIGLPGDHVSITSHNVIVNNRSLSRAEAVEGDYLVVTEQSGQHSWRVQWKKNSASPGLRSHRPARRDIPARRQSRPEHRLPPVRHGAAVRSCRQRAANLVFPRRGRILWDRLGKILE